MKYKLFDTVKLTKTITLEDGQVVPVDTVGTLVETFQDGEAYLIQLLGDWVKYDADEALIPATCDEPEAFIETLGVETVYPNQIQLIKSASETVGIRAQLLALIDEMPETLLQEVVDFAEFLKQKAA